LSGPRSDGLGNPLESATGAVTGVAGAIGDLSVEDILKTGVALSVAVVVITLAINAAPFAAKGTAQTIKHVPSVIGEILRAPFRLGGWLKTIRKDANPEEDK